MHRRTRWTLGSLIATCFLTCLCAEAQAMRFWRFRITRDGKPAFTGGIGMHDRTPPTEVLKTGLHRSRIQLARDSALAGEETTGDVTLEGNVVFAFPDLPPLEVKRLRLVYQPTTRDKTHPSRRTYDWLLHPEDVKMILRHYGVADETASVTPVESPQDAASSSSTVASHSPLSTDRPTTFVLLTVLGTVAVLAMVMLVMVNWRATGRTNAS